MTDGGEPGTTSVAIDPRSADTKTSANTAFWFRIADAAFVACLLVTFVVYFVKSRSIVLNGDDWLIAPRGNTFIDYFRPYEQNLSVVPIAVYHFVFTLWGFGAYWPLRLVGVVSGLLVGVVMFLVVRSRWGSAVALAAGVAILWYPGTLLTPSLFNHWLALIGSVVAGWALTLESRRGDWIAGLALAFAFCSSGVGVAGAAGCLTYVLLTRGPTRRWIAVGLPTLLFAVWWFTLGSSDHGTKPKASLLDQVRYVIDGIRYSFQLVAPATPWIGTVIAVMFVVYVVWQVRQGVRAAALTIAWSMAILAWWVGLAFERSGAAVGVANSFRYRVVTCLFAALALLPLARSERLRRITRSPRAVLVALVASAVLIAVNAPGIFQEADNSAVEYRAQVAKMIVLNLGPEFVPDDTIVRFDLFTPVSARRYRALVDKYGFPQGSRPTHPDAALVRLTALGLRAADTTEKPCTPLEGPTRIPSKVDIKKGVDPLTKVVLRAGPSPVTLQARRFEDSWITIGRIDAGATVELDLPVVLQTTQWTITADGACRVPN